MTFGSWLKSVGFLFNWFAHFIFGVELFYLLFFCCCIESFKLDMVAGWHDHSSGFAFAVSASVLFSSFILILSAQFKRNLVKKRQTKISIDSVTTCGLECDLLHFSLSHCISSSFSLFFFSFYFLLSICSCSVAGIDIVVIFKARQIHLN